MRVQCNYNCVGSWLLHTVRWLVQGGVLARTCFRHWCTPACSCPWWESVCLVSLAVRGVVGCWLSFVCMTSSPPPLLLFCRRLAFLWFLTTQLACLKIQNAYGFGTIFLLVSVRHSVHQEKFLFILCTHYVMFVLWFLRVISVRACLLYFLHVNLNEFISI